MAAPTVYTDKDASAPVLSGQTGELIALFKACLVDGYGAKSAAGWAEVYTGSGLSAMQQGAGLGHYIMIDDTAAQMTRWLGYETMSAISTGTGDYPTSAQLSGGLYIRKSTTANSTARPWIMLASDKHFYFVAYSGAAVTNITFGSGGDCTAAFGEIVTPRLTGDTKASFIIGSSDTSTSSTAATSARYPLAGYAAVPGRHWAARSYTGSGTSTAIGKRAHDLYCQTTSGDFAAARLELSADVFEMGRVNMTEGAATAQVLRGAFPGLFNVSHSGQSLPHGQTFTARGGEYDGEQFMLVHAGLDTTGGAANPAVLAFQISEGW